MGNGEVIVVPQYNGPTANSPWTPEWLDFKLVELERCWCLVYGHTAVQNDGILIMHIKLSAPMALTLCLPKFKVLQVVVEGVW